MKWLSGYGRVYIFYKYLGKVVDILFIKSYSYIVLKSSLFSLLLQDLQLGNPAGIKFFISFTIKVLTFLLGDVNINVSNKLIKVYYKFSIYERRPLIMALSQVVAEREQALAGNAQTGTAPAPVAPQTAGKGNKSGLDAFKATGANIRQSLTDDQKAVEGSKAGTLAFVAALGNPMRKQSRVQNGQDIESYEVVGYRFKATEDIKITVADFKPDWKELTDIVFTGEKQVKAGETFDLNLVETGLLLSDIAYGGKASGNPEKKVMLSATVSQTRKEPRPVLKIDTGAGSTGSVKEGMLFVAENNNGVGVVKAGFEKFAPLFNKKKLTKVAGVGRASGEDTANIAAAFRSYYGSKLKAQQ